MAKDWGVIGVGAILLPEPEAGVFVAECVNPCSSCLPAMSAPLCPSATVTPTVGRDLSHHSKTDRPGGCGHAISVCPGLSAVL